MVRPTVRIPALAPTWDRMERFEIRLTGETVTVATLLVMVPAMFVMRTE
jgi:hypothetical protein